MGREEEGDMSKVREGWVDTWPRVKKNMKKQWKKSEKYFWDCTKFPGHKRLISSPFYGNFLQEADKFYGTVVLSLSLSRLGGLFA